MKRGILATLLGATLLFTVACKSKTDENEAIRQGVMKHLAALNKSTGMGGGMQHPGPGETPPGTMPGAMPPGHPNVTGGMGQKPADHPDFNAILNGAQGGSSQPAQSQTPPASKSKP